MGRKYLFVINSFLAGGAERSLVELLPHLVDSGVAPVIACLDYRGIGFEDEVRANGYDVRLLPGASLFAKMRSLRRLIKQEQPDLVYTSLFDADIAGRFAAIGLGIPVVSNLANTAYDPARLADPNIDARRLRIVQLVDGWTSRHLTDHFHAVSQAAKDSTVATLGVDPAKITVAKRGRNASRLGHPSEARRLASRRSLGIAADAEVVVSVGRQEYQKGQIYLVDAFAGVVAKRPDARLLIAGREGSFSADIADLIERLDLGNVVTLLGHRSDVPDVLAAADLFVFPSLYEGLGGALIEALALGLPVVASDLPALREVVRPGENAELVAPRDVAGLESAILDLLADPEKRERYGVRSRELFDAEFHIETATDNMLRLLARVADTE